MSNNGDFFVGYAAGQGANQQPEVDVQSYINQGLREGSASEYSHQSWYIQRLMRALAARNSQKQALLKELKKYAPNHPYLDETIIDEKTSQLNEHDYARLTAKTNSNESSMMLVVKMGGGIDTKGDLTMQADGVAFTESTSSDDFEANLKQVLEDLNPPFIERHRRDLVQAAEEKSRVAQVKKEASDAKFASVIKPAANFMANIFGK
jgi:hypothetical protein